MGRIAVYLDVCCLSRPFDDLGVDRVRLEAEAVKTILRRFDEGRALWISSDVVAFEIAKIPNPTRATNLVDLESNADVRVSFSSDLMRRAIRFRNHGIRTLDAMHLAAAEVGAADVFLTTDYALLRKLRRFKGKLDLAVTDPVAYLMEDEE